jgi:hypothetical protein
MISLNGNIRPLFNQKLTLGFLIVIFVVSGGCTVYLPPVPYIRKKPPYYKELKRNRTFIDNALKQREILPSEGKAQEKYALLINSDTAVRHLDNMHLAYESLKNMGFREENIIVLKCSPFLKYDDPFPYHISASALKSNLIKVWMYYEKEIDEDDLLLVYVTGHGYRKDMKSWFLMEEKNVSSEEYAKEMQKIKAGTIVSILDPCNSGGFANAMRSNRRAITVTDTDGGNETNCKYFAQAFWTAFSNNEFDINQDGKVSIKEAYDVAIREHKLHWKKSMTRGIYYAPKCKPDVVL